MLDPGGAIIGGTDKAVSVVAKTSGCYEYSVGACVSGAIRRAQGCRLWTAELESCTFPPLRLQVTSVRGWFHRLESINGFVSQSDSNEARLAIRLESLSTNALAKYLLRRVGGGVPINGNSLAI